MRWRVLEGLQRFYELLKKVYRGWDLGKPSRNLYLQYKTFYSPSINAAAKLLSSP